MYPVPPKAETYATTERYIGNYFKSRGYCGDRNLARKIAGPGNTIDYIREKTCGTTASTSPKPSMRTPQAPGGHLISTWPTSCTGRSAAPISSASWVTNTRTEITPLEDTLEALSEQVKAGKIRHIGLSNETPWGTHALPRLAEARGWPRAVSIQNPYNLLNRSFEIGLVRHPRNSAGCWPIHRWGSVFCRGDEGGARPPKGRLSLYSRFSRYFNPQRSWKRLVRRRGTGPGTRPGPGVGIRHAATVRDQQHHLGQRRWVSDSNIASFELKLSDERWGDRGDSQHVLLFFLTPHL